MCTLPEHALIYRATLIMSSCFMENHGITLTCQEMFLQIP